jgi:hypothetical protein
MATRALMVMGGSTLPATSVGSAAEAQHAERSGHVVMKAKEKRR